jgi:hypothetical protein
MRRVFKLGIALAVALGAVIIAAWIYHCQLRATNEGYIAELTARGEPLTLAQVLPPPVQAAENSADVFLQAWALLDADTSLLKTNHVNAMLAVAPGQALVCSQLPQAPGDYATNSWAEVEGSLAKSQTALALLQKITDHPALDFHLHYERGMGDGFDFTNLHLGELKKSAQFLSSAAIIALHDGQVPAAVNDERAALALVQAMQGQRLAISELVRMTMMNIEVSSCWEVLQTPGVTEPQLAALQKDWERLDFIRGGQDALDMERVLEELTLSALRSPANGRGCWLGLGNNAKLAMGMGLLDSKDSWSKTIQVSAKTYLMRFWWSYPDELRALKGYEVLLGTPRYLATNECFQTALANQQAGLDASQTTSSIEDPSDNFFFSADSDIFRTLMSMSVYNLSHIFNRVMAAETARQMTITAIALQRCKLAHGGYPDTLAALVPEFLAAVPPDPVDGRPLRYRRLEDGTFLLYSVGENGVDDGGNPALDGKGDSKSSNWQNRHARDWVWPQPAAAGDFKPVNVQGVVGK